VPGPELRVREGDLVRIKLHNRLPVPTTIHWHGIDVPLNQDGVPGLS
jgi:FtsP/CotA-like multicopper oxidase with cupredoxin domain